MRVQTAEGAPSLDAGDGQALSPLRHGEQLVAGEVRGATGMHHRQTPSRVLSGVEHTGGLIVLEYSGTLGRRGRQAS
jgi:hypothetical protein